MHHHWQKAGKSENDYVVAGDSIGIIREDPEIVPVIICAQPVKESPEQEREGQEVIGHPKVAAEFLVKIFVILL